ncbi:MAG: hypothetical protein KC609_20580 [Myxococcales bacterium]|nr:hypothetical protein [Myxococcales bacterium]
MSEHQPATINDSDIRVPDGHAWNKLPAILGGVGLIGLAASFVLRGEHPEQFSFSYLVAFLYFLSIALGGLFFILINFASKAGWSISVRRVAENVMATLPLFVLLAVPLFLGFEHLYHHWLHASVEDVVVQGKKAWLNKSFFSVRTMVYVVIWALLGLFYYSRSVKQDQSGEPKLTEAMQNMSYPGIAIFAITTSFAAFDWIMSMDPHWYSTIYGVYFFAGCLIGIFATMILLTLLAKQSGLLKQAVNLEHFHDLGKLLFAFTVFWAYIAFSQFMLYWYGNIPEETAFFAKRWYVVHHEGTALINTFQTSSWATISVILGVGHFVVPFFFLMPRTIKRKPAFLAFGAIWMLAMHLVDIYWLVMPENPHMHGFHLTLLDLTTWVGVGGLFLGAFFWVARRQALVPLKDPRLPESLRFENF